VFISSVRYNPLDGYLYVLEDIPASLYKVKIDGSSKQLFATLSADYAADNIAIDKEGTFYITRFSNPIVTRVSADGTAIEDFTIGK
jgi:sugar lactone lactonase YvrE